MLFHRHNTLHKSAFLCSLLLLATSVPLTGCTAQKKTASTYKEPLMIDVFDFLANYQGLQSGWW